MRSCGSVLDLEHRFGRITPGAVRVHYRQGLKAQPFSTVVFADLHEAAAPLAPFCKFSAIYTVVAIHATRRILIRRINMPMSLDIGSPVPSALNYPPMPDALDLTCQT